jgi:hypothetical protein
MKVETMVDIEAVIEAIKKMTPEERRRVRQALRDPPESAGPAMPIPKLTREEAYRLLDEGWCEGDGRPYADTIDDALYGSDE